MLVFIDLVDVILKGIKVIVGINKKSPLERVQINKKYATR